MAGWTNKGKYYTLGVTFRAEAIPGTAFAVALFTSAGTPTADTNVFTDLTEIAAGNGYTSGGIDVDRSDGSGAPIGFDVWTEDDGADRGLVQIEDLVWTASGGPLPASGNGARWAGLTDRNVTVNSRLIWIFWDLVSDRAVSIGQTLTLQNCEIRINES